MRHERNRYTRSALLALILTLCALAAAGRAGAENVQQRVGQPITVYKSATCGLSLIHI